MIHLTAETVSIITGPTLVPFVASALTHARAPKWVVGIVQILLAAGVGLVSVSLGSDGGAVISQQAVVNAAITAGLSLGSYFGVWRYFGWVSKLWPSAPLGRPAPVLEQGDRFAVAPAPAPAPVYDPLPVPVPPPPTSLTVEELDVLRAILTRLARPS